MMKKVMMTGALILTAGLAQETNHVYQFQRVETFGAGPMEVHGSMAGAIGAPGAPGMFVFASEMAFDGAVVKASPYSADAVTETTQTLQDGNHIHRTTQASLFRDSEGRTRREQTLGEIGPLTTSGEPLRTIMISDPVAGVTYMLDSHTKTAHKMPAKGAFATKIMAEGKAKAELRTAGPGNVEFHSEAPGVVAYRTQINGKMADEAKNVKTESLGTQSIEGVPADGTRTTMTIPAGAIGNEQPIQVVTERWYSSQLKTTVMTRTTDPRMGETVYKLQNIKLAEPPAEMFTVPSDYTVQQ